MMMISKLPTDLLEEILSRVPVKSMGAVRSTCKNWNALSKDKRFTDKHISKASREKEFLMITKDHRVYLININLYKTHDKKFDLSITRKVTHVTRENSGEAISIRDVYQCNGLLLCVLRDIHNMFVVWNPYLCKRRWIKVPSGGYGGPLAFGYDNSSCGSFKILMFNYTRYRYQIYDSNSNSWRVTGADDPYENIYRCGVSLKGDYYWYARSYATNEESYMLSCFDFTKERFGQRLPLSVDPRIEDRDELSLSEVREDQLGLLVNRWGNSMLEVWVTNTVEPGAVSWRHLIKVHINPLLREIESRKFYIVEEENIVVVFGGKYSMFRTCIIGENGYFKKVDLRKCIDIPLEPFVGSYVPTSVQIN